MLYYYFKIDMAENIDEKLKECAETNMKIMKESFSNLQAVKNNPLSKILVVNNKYNKERDRIEGVCIVGNMFFINQQPSKYTKDNIRFALIVEIFKFITNSISLDIKTLFEFREMFDINIYEESLANDVLNNIMTDSYSSSIIKKSIAVYGSNYEIQNNIIRSEKENFITTSMHESIFKQVYRLDNFKKNKVIFYNKADINFVCGISDVIYKYSLFGIGYNMVDLSKACFCLDVLPASVIYNIDEFFMEKDIKQNMIHILKKFMHIPFAQLIIEFDSENAKSFYYMKELYKEAEKLIGYKPKIATKLGIEYYTDEILDSMMIPSIPLNALEYYLDKNIKELGIKASKKDIKYLIKYLKFIRRPDKSFPAVKQLHMMDIGNTISRFLYGSSDIASEVDKIIKTFESDLESYSSLSDVAIPENTSYDSLIGMDDIKQNIDSIAFKLSIDHNRKKKGKEGYSYTNNFCFLGNPGCGKTEMARYLYNRLKEKKVISGKYLELGRSDIIMEYIGHTGKRVKELLEQSKNGMFFLDEAYSLVDDEFSIEALTTILQGMETYKNTIFVFAGYKEEMKKFIKSNPGFRSRITYNIEFPDYTDEQLVDIFKNMCKRKDIRYDKKIVNKVYESIKLNRCKDFGNARYVRNLIDKAINSACLRMIKNGVSPDNMYSIKIKDEDIKVSRENSDNKFIGFKK